MQFNQPSKDIVLPNDIQNAIDSGRAIVDSLNLTATGLTQQVRSKEKNIIQLSNYEKDLTERNAVLSETGDSLDKQITEKRQEIRTLEKQKEVISQEIKEKEKTLDEKSADLIVRESAIVLREESVAMREKEADKREKVLEIERNRVQGIVDSLKGTLNVI